MNNLILYVYSLDKGFVLEIKNDSKESVARYIELISIFLKIENNQILLEPMLQMNSNLREKYNIFINKYRKNSPKLNRLKNILDKIKDEEYFFASNKNNYTTKEILFIGKLVTVYNHTSDDKVRANLFQEMNQIENKVFGEVLENYKVDIFDTSNKKFIGENDRKKRICRFCKNGMNTDVKVTFRLKAHAISEALGNKLLVLNEECDECNSRFGSNIETDFIQYLDIYRVFFKVKGKNGVPTIKYKDYGLIKSIPKEEIPQDDLINTDNLMVVVSRNIKFNKETGNLNVLLESQQTLKEINIYKTLCKYVLSTIDEEELQYLQDTISWINSEDIERKSLPNVAMSIVNEMFTENPILSVYIRKNNLNYPHVVAEFRFKSLIFVFILPFSTKDVLDYSGKEVYRLIWKVFKHYDFVKTWNFYDFSSIKKKKYQFNINLNKSN